MLLENRKNVTAVKMFAQNEDIIYALVCSVCVARPERGVVSYNLIAMSNQIKPTRNTFKVE